MAEHVLISGAGSGIGQGLVKALRARGRRVTACFRDEAELRGSAFEQGPELKALAFDQRSTREVQEAAARVDEPVDAVIACAGVFGGASNALSLSLDEAADLFEVNTLGTLRMVHAFLPHLRRAPAPRIGVISSVLGSMQTPGSKNLAYRISKAGLNKLVRGLAEDLYETGVAVLALEPGWVKTPMGGPNALVEVEDSARGLLEQLDRATPNAGGLFVDYLGSEVPW